MALPLAIAAAEAALFTGGCAAIHALRRQADGVTLALAGILAVLAVVASIAATPEAYLAMQAEGAAAETGPAWPGG